MLSVKTCQMSAVAKPKILTLLIEYHKVSNTDAKHRAHHGHFASTFARKIIR